MNLQDKLDYFEIKISEDQMIDFKEIFGNDRPLHLEIGSGKGEFIQLQSLFLHAINFVGIELKAKRIITIVKKLDREKNANVRVTRLFVDEKINNWIPRDCFEQIYIYHPDPWPKRKHHKNRMIQHPFIDALSHILKPKGILRISTDHPDYAEWIIKKFSERDDYEPLFDQHSRYIIPEDHFWTYFDEVKTNEGYIPQFLFYRKIR